jgi:ADP-ribosylglycohydrolase
MTLALAQSFVDSHGQYDHALSIQNYLDWFNHGRFSTTHKAWDLGRSTRIALRVWKARGLDDLALAQHQVNEQLNQEGASGNGSLMRISPIGIALWKDSDRAKRFAREQSLITHPALACPDACEAYTEVICMAMNGMFPDSRLFLFSFISFGNRLT